MAQPGKLLDVLTVKLELDMSGFQRGIGQAIAQINTLRGAIAGGSAGVSLGDAVNAALTAPLLLAVTRIGQVRTEMRALTSEMRQAAALGFGGGAARGAGAGGAVVAAGASGGLWAADLFGMRNVTPRRPRLESDDLLDAARGDFNGRRPRDAQEEERPRRRRGLRDWLREQPGRTRDAYDRGVSNHPGISDAVDNLGGAAHRVGANARGAMSSRVAQALGLTGLGSLLGSLVGLAGSLATVLGGVLAGAIAALVTPVGLLVAAFAALTAIWVAANWDSFKEFAEWFGERASTLFGEGIADIVAGWGNFGAAVTELWNLIRSAFSDDSGSATGALKVFGEVVLRVVNAAMELLGALGNTLAELVRAFTSLLQGDMSGALEHFQRAYTECFKGLGETIASLFPELRGWFEALGGWIGDVTAAFGDMWDKVVGHSYVPDMVNGIEEHFARLPAVMVDVAKAACGEVAGAFEGLAKGVSDGLGNIVEGVSGELHPFADRMRELSINLGDALVGIATGATTARSALSDLLSMAAGSLTRRASESIADMFDAVFASTIGKGSGGGGGKSGRNFLSTAASFVGKLFGFEGGGRPPVGVPSIVGERDWEVFVPDAPGRIYNQRQLAALAANENRGGGGDRRLHVTYDLRGAEGDVAIERKIARANAQLLRQVNENAPARMASFQRLGT